MGGRSLCDKDQFAAATAAPLWGLANSGWKQESQRTISSLASVELPTWQCCSAPSRAVKMRAVTEWAQVTRS